MMSEPYGGELDDLGELNETIQRYDRILNNMVGDHASRPGLLTALGISYLDRFELLDLAEDLEKSVDFLSQAALLTPDGHADKPQILGVLSESHMFRYERFGELADVDQAITCRADVVALTRDRDVDKPRSLRNLGASYQRRFERLGELVDLDRVIACKSEAMLLISDGDADKALMLSSLAISYQARFERLNLIADIDSAITYLSEAVLLTPDGHIYRCDRLTNLGISHQMRFERLDELKDVDRAISCHSEAVFLTPNGHVERPTTLNNLGISLHSRFERLGGLMDLDRAIVCKTEAVFLTPDGHADKPARLSNLGNSHLRRFERYDDLADIERAIICLSDAVSLTADNNSQRPGRLGNLGNAHQRRFERLGELTDINQAISCQSEAASLTPDGNSHKLTLIANLGNSHKSRFERLGELTDIDQAIIFQSEAESLTPNGHAYKSERLNNLGNSYRCRFDRLGELADIEQGITYNSMAVSLTPDGHALKPIWLNNLGSSHQCRFERLGELADIDRAIVCNSEAASLTPDGHTSKPGWLTSLGISHLRRFECLGELTDINRALECNSEAVALTPDRHADKPALLINLGISHQSRYKRFEELADIDQAIITFSKALLLTPDVHTDRPMTLNHLGISYGNRFERLGEPADLAQSITHLQAAAQSATGKLTIRLKASIKWARFAAMIDHPNVISAYHWTMQLVPQAIWIGTTVSTRYNDIRSVGVVAVEAAAAAISAKEYGTALEWLEAGRSIVWSQTLQLRTEFDDLALIAPDLANDLKQVAQELEVTSQRDTTKMADSHTLEAIAQRHHFLAAQYEKLLASTRKLPGFQGFMQSKKVDDLVLATQSGPVVMINVHATRCDALILRPSCQDVAHVPLPGLTQDHAAQLHRQMQQLLTSGRAGQRRPIFEKPPNAQFESVLAALWYTIANPVLSYLGYLEKPSTEPLPHITWCTTGALSFLPIHAAGCYVPGGQKIFDFAISSYSPTLGALLSARSGSSQVGGILAVGQEATPGCQPLAGTKPELAHIQQHARAIPHKLLQGDQATVEAVIKDMEEYSSVHLACHGSQIIRDPTSSCFHLHDGSLSLAAIAKKSFKNKGLAFLSACETAAGDEKMPDEAVHLAAGMLAAGYPTVIATMWSIDDGDAPVVADLVYGELMKDGKLGNGQAARALHKAVKALRERAGENQFSRWVPYIHIGV